MVDSFGVLIVTFNSSMDVFNIINSAMSSTEVILVVDNGSSEGAVKEKLRSYSLNNSNFYFIELESNTGLGYAQNYGLKKMKELNVNYVILFDQDSEVTSDFFIDSLEAYKVANNIFENLGILVPVYIDKKENQPALFTVKEGRRYIKTFINEPYQRVSFANASGMIFRLDLVEELGGMREDFFIDQIDVEFCKRVTEAGYTIVATNQLKIVHTVGEGQQTRIGKLTIKHSNHNALRRYYIARNSIIVRNLYKDDRVFVRLVEKRLMKTFFVCFLEKKKFSKIFAIIRGAHDGIFYKK